MVESKERSRYGGLLTRACSRQSRLSREGTTLEPDLQETCAFLIHYLDRLLYGFDRLDAVVDSSDGGIEKAFHLDAIYNYIAAFLLLDAKKQPPGGSAHSALDRHGKASLLDELRAVIDQPLDGATFGEVVLWFRNQALVHPGHGDADVDKVYAKVNMLDPQVADQFREGLMEVRRLSRGLAEELLVLGGMQIGRASCRERG